MSNEKKVDVGAIAKGNPGVDVRLLEAYEKLVRPLGTEAAPKVAAYTLKRALDDRVSDLMGYHLRADTGARRGR